MKFGTIRKLKLPDEPGVYLFRDKKRRPIYIGRATSLKNRVKSYFSASLINSRGPRIVDMVTKSSSITWQKFDSVLEAVLLEAELIKKYQPYYNIAERDDKSSQYVVITDEPWPRVFLARARDLEQSVKDGNMPYKIREKFGPYPDSSLIRDALKILRNMFPFKDKKSLDHRHEVFYRMIGQSPKGNSESDRQNYRDTISYLCLFFRGKKKKLIIQLNKQMKSLSKQLRFEEAQSTNRLIHALRHINDISLIKQDSLNKFLDNTNDFRIEAYDISHLSGFHNVGVMVVSVNNILAKNEYRKFKISRDRNDDIAGLGEILSRRLNHSEWRYPDLIVVDGGAIQAKHTESILMARRINIPIVAVTKNKSHKVSSLLGHPDIIKCHKNEIIKINAEAHRFALKYHHKRREGMLNRVVQ